MYGLEDFLPKCLWLIYTTPMKKSFDFYYLSWGGREGCNPSDTLHLASTEKSTLLCRLFCWLNGCLLRFELKLRVPQTLVLTITL